MSQAKIRRVNFKLIETELYCYHASREEFNKLRQEIMEIQGSSSGSCRTIGSISDPTALKVSALNSAFMLEVESRLKAIEHVLLILGHADDPGKAELVRLRYFEKVLTDKGIQLQLNISQSTFTRWNKEVIRMIADRLGFDV